MVNKILKAVGGILLLLIISAFAIPYFFKDQIKARIEKSINESVDATVTFKDANLSLFKNFPKANVSVKKIVIINKAPFEGDTLVAFDELNIKLSVLQLFNGDNEPTNIEGVSSKNGLINIIFNKDGIGNFDIALKNKDTKDGGKSKPIALKIKGYEVENLKFKFTNEASKMKIILDSVNHSGKGDFTNNILDLETKTSAKGSISIGKMNYLKNIAVSLDAVLGINLIQKKYSFKQNKAKINDLALEFDGFIQMVKQGQLFDIKFKTPSSSFKNFLGLIPTAYNSTIEHVKTTGNFTVSGFTKGLKSNTSIPKFNVAIASKNASFKYPNLQKAVKNITIDAKIINETGVTNETYVNLDKLSFSIDKDIFDANANIKNITTNALVNATIKGTINLGNLSSAYPIKLTKPLSGILKADVTTKFDMASIEKSEYQNIRNAGKISVFGFKYSDDKGKVMNVNSALIAFNPNHVNLQEFKATIGKSDISMLGVLDNFYGFIFRKQELKGNFNMTCNQLAISDFMTASEPIKSNSKSTAKAMKIPGFLNCSLSAKANTVLYDNLILKDCSGKLIIKDQSVTLENVKTNIFGGQIGVNGMVSTKEKNATFNMNLELNKVDINQTFTKLMVLKKIAPIAGVINGNLNSTINLSGNLISNEMAPDLKTISGNLLGQLLSVSITPNKSSLLSALGSNIKFLDATKLNLNDIKVDLSFKDGIVTVKPFDLKYQDIKVTVSGTHGFDQSINYNLKLDVPIKKVGGEVNALATKLAPSEGTKSENILVNAKITGSFSKPKVSTDLKEAITNFITSLVKQQKQKLFTKGASLLEDLINKNNKSGDTTKTKKVVNQVKDLLNGLFGKKKTP
jgi:hypothetical protein